MVIEEVQNDIENITKGGIKKKSISDMTHENVRHLKIRTEMWLEHTSYLSHVLLLPTWWMLAKPLGGFIHQGVVENIQTTSRRTTKQA